MSESALLEKEKTEEDLFKHFKSQFKEAGPNYNLREAIIRQIREGKRPPPTDEEVSLESLRKMDVTQREKAFQESIDKPVVGRPPEEKINKMDEILKTYSEQIRPLAEKAKNDSVPPGEVLRFKDDWEEYGWRKGDENKGIDSDKKKVKDKLKEYLTILNLTDDQLEIMLELFVAKGKRPEDILEPEKMESLKVESDSRYNLLSDSEKREFKFSPDIYFLKSLGIEEEIVRHFILTDIYEQENDQEIYYQSPKNIEDLAYQIIQAPGKGEAGYGIKGITPLLEMRIAYEKDENGNLVKDKDGRPIIDKNFTGYRVNTSNMVRWARYNMNVAYELDREDPQDFFQKIAVKTRYPITLQEMLLNPAQYFISKDGKTEYNQLLLEWYKEAVIFGTVRTWDASYREVAGDGEELMKVFRAMYNTKNLFTRGALGSNILNLMSTMPLDFEGTKDGKWQSDGVMGAAWIDIYRAYDSISDYEGLQKVLGPGSKFFTKTGWLEAFSEVAKENMDATGVSKFEVFAPEEQRKFFDAAFDDNGEISSEKNRINFIKFISIFGEKMGGSKREFSVRWALRNAIAEKYGKVVETVTEDGKEGGKVLYKRHAFVTKQGEKGKYTEDKETLKVAEAIAWSLAKPFGAGAKNDPDAVAHDYMARVYNTQLLRQKYPHRGDKFGNEFTMMQFKRTGIDLLNGIVTETPIYLYDEKGKPIKNKEGKHAQRDKTPMEVFVELSEFQTLASKKIRDLEDELKKIGDIDNGKGKDSQAYKEKQKQLEQHVVDSNKAYQQKAQQMSFRQRTLSNYYEDHLRNSYDLYKQLTSAEEIAFEKFTEYNVYGGTRFKQAEFQKEVQDKWIHKIRYMIDTYPSLNFNMKVRVLDQTETNKRHWGPEHRDNEPKYHEVYLGEAMFGHQMLNRAEFWKRDDKGKPINKRDTKGRKVKGVYEIDYQKVQDNKQQVWKQWFMTKIAGDLYAHRALHGNEPRYNFTYYTSVIDSIARIPGDIDQNEYNFRDNKTTKYFFNKKDMAWFKDQAKVSNYSLYWKAILKDLFMDDKPEEGIGLLLALSLATKAIIEQKV